MTARMTRIIAIPRNQIEGSENDIVHWKVVERFITNRVVKSWMASDTMPEDKENYFCYGMDRSGNMRLL